MSKEEFDALKTAILAQDGSQGKKINGKKFMIIGSINDGSCNLKCGKENVNVTVGTQYVLVLKGKEDAVIEQITTASVVLSRALHGE